MTYVQKRQSPPTRAGSGEARRLGGQPNYTTVNSDPYERLLAVHQQITGYQARGSGRHVRISCPACGTGTLKVSVSRADNGSVLIHAFCGHSPAEVLDALGLSLSDLFPLRDFHRLTDDQKRELRRQTLMSRWLAALAVLDKEAYVALAAANQLAEEVPLSAEDLARLRVATVRIFDAAEILRAR